MSTKLRKFPEKSWKRILTHELCHLEIFSKRSWIITNVEFIFYLLSKKIRNRVEREANILMIQKGFGNEVLTARKGNISRGLEYSLSEKEIRDYIKKYSQKQRKNKNSLE
jgi:predicted metal-dependent hydrolase